MGSLNYSTHIHNNWQTVADLFNQDLFERLAPPLLPMEILLFDGIDLGDKFILDLGGGQRWEGEITFHRRDHRGLVFIDEGRVLPWPLMKWKHTHKVEPKDNDCMIVDQIEFSTRWGTEKITQIALEQLFRMRQRRYRSLFNR